MISTNTTHKSPIEEVAMTPLMKAIDKRLYDSSGVHLWQVLENYRFQSDAAKELGVSEACISRWKKRLGLR